MAVLATIGAIDTGAITLKRWGLLGPLSCPGGAEGCDKVLNSAWGSISGRIITRPSNFSRAFTAMAARAGGEQNK